jgi:HSF-type DNA-binding
MEGREKSEEGPATSSEFRTVAVEMAALATANAPYWNGSSKRKEDSPDESTHLTPPSLLPPSPLVTPPVATLLLAPRSSQQSFFEAKSVRSAASVAAKRGIPHTYHDYSQAHDQMSFVRKKTGGVTQPFPEKLHDMLMAETSPEAQAIVSWLPHGRAFVVRKPKIFTADIMPKYVYEVCAIVCSCDCAAFLS